MAQVGLALTQNSSSGSSSHPVSNLGTRCAPKDLVSTIPNSAQNHNVDGTACGPYGSNSHPILSLGTECAPSRFSP